MTSLTLAGDWDAVVVPEGTEWPGPDTLVLLHRDLLPGTDVTCLSRFAEDVWDVNPAIFEDHTKARSINFASIPRSLRLEAKYYIWQLLNHPKPIAMPRASAVRPAPSTVVTLFPQFKKLLEWLSGRGVNRFDQVTLDLLDDYLAHLADLEVGLETKYRQLTEVRRLWAYRAVLPQRMRLPDAPPWGGEDSHELFGRMRADAENRTPRLDEQTMQMTLFWALRFVEDFSEDILAAHAEHLDLHAKTPDTRRRYAPAGSRQTRHRPGELAVKVRAYLDGLRERGEPLPGKRDKDGTLKIDWRHLGRIMDCAGSIETYSTGDLVRQCGLPIGEDVPLDAPITAVLDGRPWRRRRIGYHEAPVLARLLATACFIIVAYLSGARPGEVLNLRRGCVERDEANDLWLMRGLFFKGAKDKDGNKLPAGQHRRDPWVVVEIVARSIAVMERLHPHHLLFPNRIEPYHSTSRKGVKRKGTARTDGVVAEDLKSFTAWVNATCQELGRSEVIPPDGKGPLAASRFRRTLAWFIRRRPRGLVAAAIQYGHLHTRLLQGYAGSYESGFPDDFAFEDWLCRMEGIAEDERALAAGEHVSGPAAGTYRTRVTTARDQFAGTVLTSIRQARDLVGNPLLQIHHGKGMTCVLDPVTAACRLRGTRDDPQVTPDQDDCRPQCPCLVHTDRDIAEVREQVAELEEVVADTLAPSFRHARDQHELDRLREIVANHERTRPEADR
ncbi:hypothetical protein ACWC5I_01110 [Kitasatospora sp. NPDC001574]